MKHLLFCFLFFQQFFASGQELAAVFVEEQPLKADIFIGVDTFENYYFIRGTTVYKKSTSDTYTYTNTQLGTISSVDITNPLKIVLFYRDFNTVVILDNRLNELSNTINLTTEAYAKNAAFVSISSINNLWLYSLDDNQLSLWNYKNKKTIFNTQSLSFYKANFQGVLQTSNYEFCWLISENEILKFNEYGSFINSFTETNIQKVVPYNDGIIYLKNNKLYHLQDNNSKMILVSYKKHDLNHFWISKDNLYFFDSNVLYIYTFFKK
tara:strand:- start:16005 stop:16802 length:798 start_codon:yes stop_codon:yes gene_type:complete